MNRATSYLAFGVVTMLAGCSTYVPEPELGTQEYREMLAVLVQACSANPSDGEHLIIFQVDRYGRRGELRHEGPLIMKRITPNGSFAVTEGFSAGRQTNLMAIFVNVGDTEYLFSVADKVLSTEHWTAWEPAVSMNGRDELASWKVANQRNDYQIHAPVETAPKARYRLIRNIDWWNKLPRQNDDIPPCR